MDAVASMRGRRKTDGMAASLSSRSVLTVASSTSTSLEGAAAGEVRARGACRLDVRAKEARIGCRASNAVCPGVLCSPSTSAGGAHSSGGCGFGRPESRIEVNRRKLETRAGSCEVGAGALCCDDDPGWPFMVRTQLPGNHRGSRNTYIYERGLGRRRRCGNHLFTTYLLTCYLTHVAHHYRIHTAP